MTSGIESLEIKGWMGDLLINYISSFQFQINLQIKLTNLTGVDPLEGTVFSNNPGIYLSF